MNRFCRWYQCNNDTNASREFCSKVCRDNYYKFLLPEISPTFLVKLNRKTEKSKSDVINQVASTQFFSKNELRDYIFYLSWKDGLLCFSAEGTKERDEEVVLILKISDMINYREV